MACITGDETGIVKVWDITRSSHASVKYSYGTQTRSRGVASMCWVDGSTSQIIMSRQDGTLSEYDVKSDLMLSTVKRGIVGASATSMQVVDGKLVMAMKDGRVAVTAWKDDADTAANCEADEENLDEGALGPAPPPPQAVNYFGTDDTHIEACHVQRRFGMMAVGGKDNDLTVWNLRGERDEPLFKAQNVRDHVLDVAHPVYVVGAQIVDYHVVAAVTAYHNVRFYDRRVGTRPVQDFGISREITRRPTSFLQWNCNKFLIGEASGDIHLYDTRRGFASRAKLRGGVGSVRHMVKHPAGHQLMVATGLDRKARIYHVPTGKLLCPLYLKQKGTCCLLDKNTPFADNTASYSFMQNRKVAEDKRILSDSVWDNMDPVVDEFEDDEAAAKKAEEAAAKKASKKADAKKEKPVVKGKAAVKTIKRSRE